MAAPNDSDSSKALEKELKQLERRLKHAKHSQARNTETLVDKLRRGFEAARRQEHAIEEKLMRTEAESPTAAQQRQSAVTHQSLADARARTLALSQEMAEAQAAQQDFPANKERQAERAQQVAQETLGREQRRQATPGDSGGPAETNRRQGPDRIH